jgi:hypothetical protein
MNNRDLPKAVRDKLLALSAQYEHWSEKAQRTADAINNARARLTGKFANDAAYEDTFATLKKLAADLPIVEAKRDAAERILERCQAWLDELPDVNLEIVKPKPINGSDLNGIREQLRHAQDELEDLAKVPVPSADIEMHVRDYVAGLGRPKVSGIDGGALPLAVVWPDDAVSLFALLMPDKMVEVILAEINRAANTPMPLDQRRKRMAELRRMIDELQRQAFAMGDAPYNLDPAIILGVRVVKREPVNKIERRVAANV